MTELLFNIAAVERDTGLSKDVLRMWERRYGFPQPQRDGNGERSYPAAQVERLRLIKRLMDQGHRPGRLMQAAPEVLESLQGRQRTEAEINTLAELEPLMHLLDKRDIQGFRHAMQQRLAREGLHQFVLDIVVPLTEAVGVAWETGRLEVFDEHLFTELTKRVLRQAIGNLPEGRIPPCILLTTPPDEQHELGLLMVEALYTLEGAHCIAMGPQMPLLELSHAARAHRADVVALSFSASFPSRQIAPLLRQLRSHLPEQVALWAGGAGMLRQPALAGVLAITTLETALAALHAWRDTHGQSN